MRLVLLGKSNPCSSDSDGDGLNDGRVSFKNGNIIAKKKGNVTVKVKVTLKDGTTKTVKVKVKVK